MEQIIFQSSRFKIKYPSDLPAIISLGIIMVIHMRTLQLIMNDNNIQILFYFGSSWLLLSVIMLAIMIYRQYKFLKPSVLLINPESIIIHDRIIGANEVERVMIKGYFKPIVGIKPINKKNVPNLLYFRFLDEEDKGMKELLRWAEHNQIPFVHKRFTRWI